MPVLIGAACFEGQPNQGVAYILDLTERKRAEDALRKRERELSLLVNNAFDAVLSIDEQGYVTEWNTQAEAMFGWGRQEAIGRRLADLLIPARYRADHERGMRHFVASEEGPWLNRRIEISALRRNGDEFPVELSIAPYRTGGMWAFNGFIRDISERKLAEAKLARATQTASLSVLSASIAHEVNQPLAAIVANSHACHRWLSAEPPNVERAKTTAERITRDANSAADVVSRIRALFRRAPHDRSPEDANHLIREVCQVMAGELAATNARIETDLQPDLPSVALDHVQLRQVFMNLIRNGIEAMEPVVDRARVLQIRSCRDDLDAIRVEVRDTGTGFKDPERVLEPFFTTKEHGMGVGLAICRSIIEAHGGRLWTANNETHGAIVAFTLPLASGEAP